jgi:UDP-3-O-[3-hydroxymyristoyl] glucosamine N-acyltransferase
MSISLTLGQLAQRLDAELIGDPTREVMGAATLESAGPQDVSFLAQRKYVPYLATTRAAGVIVGRNLGEVKELPQESAVLWVDDAHQALADALSVLYPEAPRKAGVDPTAIVADGVELGSNVSIGPYSVVGAGARLGDGVCVGSHCFIGELCELGADAELKDQVSLYRGTAIGDRCIIHSGSRIGVDGFGYVFQGNEHRKIPQVGGCVLEDDVEIGANVCIDRGSVGETRIGAGSKIDNLVHIAHNVRIGRNCIIVAQVGIAGSTTLGHGVALAGQVGIIGHLNIGDGAQVAAQAGVSHDIPAGETWFGSPARQITGVMRASAAFLKLPELLRRLSRIEKRLGSDEDTKER